MFFIQIILIAVDNTGTYIDAGIERESQNTHHNNHVIHTIHLDVQ